MGVRADIREDRIWLGESRSLEFLLTDEAGQPLDATGWTLRWAVSRHRADPPVLVKQGSAVQIRDGVATGDLIVVEIDAEDTADLVPGWYVHALWRVDPDAETVLSHGRIYLGRVP